MEATSKAQQNQQGIKAEVVCPKCWQPLQYPAELEQKIDRYRRSIRTYLGWCFRCDLGCQVVQFLQAGKWHIHKYRYYTLLIQDIHCRPTGEWITAQPLPDPAPVVIGPGGDYDRQLLANKAGNE